MRVAFTLRMTLLLQLSLNGKVEVDSNDVAIFTKKPATKAQLDTIAFKNVTLSPETFDGKAADDIRARWEANDAN